MKPGDVTCAPKRFVSSWKDEIVSAIVEKFHQTNDRRQSR